MRIKAKTLLYWRGHFVAEGQEADAPESVAKEFIAAGKAVEVPGGKGQTNQLIDLSDAPAPTQNLRPAVEVAPEAKAPTRKKAK